MRIYILLLILFFRTESISQQINFKHFNANNGLPSSCVYTSIQDSKGFMWFGTDKGVSSFDGLTFRNFDINNGLPSNTVLSLKIHNDTLIAGCRFGFRAITGHNRTSSFPVDSEEIYTNNDFYFNKNFLYSISNSQNIIVYNLKTKIIVQEQILKEQKDHPNCLGKTVNGDIIEGRETGLYKYTNGSTKVKINIPQINSNPVKSIYCSKDGTISVLSKNKIYFLKDSIITDSVLISEKYKKSTLRIIRTKDKSIWLYGLEGELIKINKQKNSYVYTDCSQIFNSRQVAINQMYEDNKNNLWINTYNNGIYCIYNSFSTHYTDAEGLSGAFINDINIDKNANVYVASNKGIYIKYADDIKYQKVEKNQLYSYRFQSFNNNLFVCQALDGLTQHQNILQKNNKHSTYDSLTFIAARRFIFYGNIMAYALWDHSILFFDKSTRKTKQIVIDKRYSRIYKIFTQNGVNFWVGTSRGLYQINYKTEQVHKVPIVTSTVTDIIDAPNNRLYVAAENGFYILQNQKWHKIINYKGKSTSNFSSFARDSKNRIWAATNKGILVSSDKNYLTEIRGYPSLLSNEVNCLTFDSIRNAMYVGTNIGVTVIDVAHIDSFNNTLPKVEFVSINYNDSTYDATSYFKANSQTSEIILNYTAIEFNNPEYIIFRYRTDDGNWIYTKERNLILTNLKYGEHKYEIQVSKDRIHWGPSSNFVVKIPAKFYQEIRFYLLLVVISIIMIYILFQQRLKSINEKNKKKIRIQKQLEDLRYQALNAAINPHFIFNAMGSIQSYVTSNSPFLASDYIAKFSRLIRITLNHAGDKHIKLNEEIERIKIYLELEKLRCGNKLTYAIEVSSELNPSFVIPNMLIQPLIENAIIHGILQSNNLTPGHIIISFTEENNKIVITVDDNGAGYDSTSTSKHGYKSIGLVNIRQRIELIPGAFFSILNKSEILDQTHGTIATIILPHIDIQMSNLNE